MYLAIVLIPLIGSIVSGFFGRKVGVRGSQYITCGLVTTTTMLSVLAFLEVSLTGTPVSIYLSKWIDSEFLNVFLGFNFDSLTTLMLIPVLFVSSAVHVYSVGYMSHDPHNQRFFSYLSLFTFMMIILVTADNYLLMFVGWEGVGICSYLLVSFWFTRIAANQSSISAILTNRVGDCFLTIGMFAIIWSLGNLDYATVFSLSPFMNQNVITFIGVCLLIGAMAKSSQVGLHVWLPMAMEGPTPVSALIHAATMVTAGVYLLIRSSPLIEYSSTVLLLCLWIGAITTLFSSLIGLFQQDIKKVIAYSTMSQLGLMVVAIGLSSYTIAIFHLINHAFYKALLFLGAGAVIHAVGDKQDFRKYGGLKQYLPLSYSVMLIASLSLVAFPFMTGYFSKDFILESSYSRFSLSSIIVYYIAVVGAMFTTLYSIKTLYLTFITNPHGTLNDYKNVHEGNIFMSLPLTILAVFSIYFGFITKDMFIGLGSDLFSDNSIFIHPSNEILINTEFGVPTLYKLLPFIFTVSITLLSLFISEYLLKNLMQFKFSNVGYNIFSFLNLRFSVELIYNRYITETILHLGGHTTKVLDKGAIEIIGPYGLQNSILYISRSLSSLDTGIVTSYALYILIGGFAYLYLPYILYNSIYIMLILLLGIIFFKLKFNKKPIVELKLKNDEMEARINFKFYLYKIIRFTLIGVVVWAIRGIIIDIFELNRDYLIECVITVNVSGFLSILMEQIWPPLHYHELGEQYSDKIKPKATKELKITKFLSGRVDENGLQLNNTTSPSNSRSPSPLSFVSDSSSLTNHSEKDSGPGGNLLAEATAASNIDQEAAANPNKLVTQTFGNLNRLLRSKVPVNTPWTMDQNQIAFSLRYDANGNVIGATTLDMDPEATEVNTVEFKGYNGSAANPLPGNPIEKTNIYLQCLTRNRVELTNLQAQNLHRDAQGNLTSAAYQNALEDNHYNAKIAEAWGIYNTGYHQIEMELKKRSNMTTPSTPSNLHPGHFPGTEPKSYPTRWDRTNPAIRNL